MDQYNRRSLAAAVRRLKESQAAGGPGPQPAQGLILPRSGEQGLIDGDAALSPEFFPSSAPISDPEPTPELLDLLNRYLADPPKPVVSTEVTILLADIRGFTALLSAYPPQLMVDLLNRFFATMCDAVEGYGGRLDKFMGDSVMAVFADGNARDDLRRGLACAAVMQQAMLDLNHGHEQRGEPALFAGIAVHKGRVMAGSFGPPRHRTDTVIGEAVNLASRMESFSLRGQVLISEAVQAAAAGWVELGPANQVRPKGVERPVTLYPVRAVHYGGRLVVPAVEPRQSPRVRVNLDALFRHIQAKRVADETFAGHVDDIGYFGLSAELPEALPKLSELAVELPVAGGADSGHLYARVLRAVPAGPAYRTSLEFTVVDTPAHRQLKALVDDRLWHR